MSCDRTQEVVAITQKGETVWPGIVVLAMEKRNRTVDMS